MSELPDWTIWLLAAAVIALFAWFFWSTGVEMLRFSGRLTGLIQNWPQVRRAMVEQEARAGGRFPLWYRAARVVLVLAMVGFAAYFIWRRFS
jgi:hypothetical protein